MQNTDGYSPVPLSVLCMTPPSSVTPTAPLLQAPQELTQVAATLPTEPPIPVHRIQNCLIKLRTFMVNQLW
jgi:hypothetical protein